jgi:aspartyl protease family protein
MNDSFLRRAWRFMAIAGLTAFGLAQGGDLSHEATPGAKTKQAAASSSVELVIPPGPEGHFFFQGEINGKEVFFVVDTGASAVVLPKSVADRIGLSGGDKTGVAHTAAGPVTVSRATIDSLVLGPIRLAKVDAAINPSDPSGLVLLGMSALRQVQMTQEGGQLILRQTAKADFKIKKSVRECMGEKKVVDKDTLRCMRGESGAE